VNGYLLDTHVWLWVQEGLTQNLSPDFLVELELSQRRRELAVSAISILEIARLVALNQYKLAVSIEEFVRQGTTADGLLLLDLSASVLIESTRLPGEIHRDPSDRLLVATAILHDLTLVTDDGKLLRYAKQGHLKARRP
jgi:PIN domain nuclease of toxin-antitoxin system